MWTDSSSQEFCFKREYKSCGESEFCFPKMGDNGACLPADGNDQ